MSEAIMSKISKIIEETWKDIDKEICDLCKADMEHPIKDCGLETKALNPYWVKKKIKNHQLALLNEVKKIIEEKNSILQIKKEGIQILHTDNRRISLFSFTVLERGYCSRCNHRNQQSKRFLNSRWFSIRN